jgi:hypothetical protein
MDRKRFLQLMLVAGGGSVLASRRTMAQATQSQGAAAKPAPLPAMTVYKSPTCGCCRDWITHARGAGFTVKSIDMDDLTQIKRDAGVPKDMESCHTVLVGRYVVEGHVPADLVKKMLDEKPAIVGLAVPGMVVGSPGMEQGSMKQPYNVIAFAAGGKTSVYARR